MKVLYAEDDLEDSGTFCETLHEIDPAIECIHVENGQEALKFLDHSAIRPDFIFLDINMPIMDGRSCLKDIKKDDRFSAIPVYIYTTDGNSKDKELCIQLGAVDCLSKPNTLQEGRKALEKIFMIERL